MKLILYGHTKLRDDSVPLNPKATVYSQFKVGVESISFKLRMLHDTGMIHSQYIHNAF